MSPIDWNVCTEIIKSRTPTPLNLADEGDTHVFRRGSGVSEFNKTPVIPPISSSNTPTKTPSNGYSNAPTPNNGYSNAVTKTPSGPSKTPAKTPSNKSERKRKPVEKQPSVEENQGKSGI
eukprot:sb/3476178/